MLNNELALTASVVVIVCTLAANVDAGPDHRAHTERDARQTAQFAVPDEQTENSSKSALSADRECEPSWEPFIGEPPLTGTAVAMAVLNSPGSSQPVLYVAGSLNVIPDMPPMSFARWDGVAWENLSGTGGSSNLLAVIDDGSGPALYGAGNYTMTDGICANCIAKWHGSGWSPIGSGMNGPIHAVAVFDDGSGPALYAAGEFTTAGGVRANNIAKWDGQQWSALGSGTDGMIHALAVFEDAVNGGSTLYAGGLFNTAGGAPSENIARWNGADWVAVGGGVNGRVRALAVIDHNLDGVQTLYVGGHFSSAGGVSTSRIANWDGAAWSAVGVGAESPVTELFTHDDGSGSGPALYAAGVFMNAAGVNATRIARWDGQSWTALGNGLDNPISAMAVYDGGLGGEPLLYAGMLPHPAHASPIMKWDGNEWAGLGGGIDNLVHAMCVFDDGSGTGPALYAAGEFFTVDGVYARRIIRWDGTAWSALGGGVHKSVYALSVFDDGSGSGPRLYAGGNIAFAGDVSVDHIARWDGTNWSALASGLSGGHVRAMIATVDALEDDGGPGLYVGGTFTTAGGIAANRIAKWDGENWSSLGSGMNGAVYALAIFDDGSGSGPALYAGGDFTSAGGVTAHRIAKWDGEQWSPLGDGVNSTVRALTVCDAEPASGSGPALYAGGYFSTADGVTANSIAKWDGQKWSPLGSVNDGIETLAVFDDGSGNGPALYAAAGWGGWTGFVKKWDGKTWSPLDVGNEYDEVFALKEFDDGSGAGPALYIGGGYRSSGFLTKWQGCATEPQCAPADLDCDGVVDVSDLLMLLSSWGTCPAADSSGSCPADLNGDGVVDVTDLLMLLANWTGGCR